jgi:hypothetical protein
MLPHRFRPAGRTVIVQNQEVAYRLDVRGENTVELFDGFGVTVTGRKERQKFGNATLDQMNAGRFQRLEEAARQADGDHVLVPGLAPPSGEKADQPRFGQRDCRGGSAKSRRPARHSQNCCCRRFHCPFGVVGEYAIAIPRRAPWSVCTESGPALARSESPGRGRRAANGTSPRSPCGASPRSTARAARNSR